MSIKASKSGFRIYLSSKEASYLLAVLPQMADCAAAYTLIEKLESLTSQEVAERAERDERASKSGKSGIPDISIEQALAMLAGESGDTNIREDTNIAESLNLDDL